MIRPFAELAQRDTSTDSIYASMVNRIQSVVADRLASGNHHAIRIGLLSCESGEGVSTCVSGLARFCAEVLELDSIVVDASLGEKQFEAMFGVEGNGTGLRQVLNCESTLEYAMVTTPVPRMQYLPIGIGAPKSFSPVAFSEFPRFLEKLNDRYQIAIFDLPPVGGDAVGVPIASQMDAVIIVIQPGKTTKERAAAASQFLINSGVNVVGALANQVETQLPPLPKLASEACDIAKEVVFFPVKMLQFAVEKWRQFNSRG